MARMDHTSFIYGYTFPEIEHTLKTAETRDILGYWEETMVCVWEGVGAPIIEDYVGNSSVSKVLPK